jgi:hypothetical protein
MAGVYSGPFPGGVAAGSAFTEVDVNHTSFSGNVTNSGTIGGGGIVVTRSTFLSGGIQDFGINSGGISVDGLSRINAHSGTAIVAGPANSTYFGGISNAGMLSGRDGIFAGSMSAFGTPGGAGGITNSGKITARATGTGIDVIYVTSFSGGITNTGNITGGRGIVLEAALVGAGT